MLYSYIILYACTYVYMWGACAHIQLLCICMYRSTSLQCMEGLDSLSLTTWDQELSPGISLSMHIHTFVLPLWPCNNWRVGATSLYGPDFSMYINVHINGAVTYRNGLRDLRNEIEISKLCHTFITYSHTLGWAFCCGLGFWAQGLQFPVKNM